MIKKIYIDADSLIYRASYISNDKDTDLAEAPVDESADDLGLDEAPETDMVEGMLSVFNSMVAEIVTAVSSDAVAKGYEIDIIPVLVITVKGSSDKCKLMLNNFRYSEMDSVQDPAVKGYKSNRAGMETPTGLMELYDAVFDLPNCMCEEEVEADDVCVYYGRQGHIVCALDKDVLGSLEYAYNYGRKEWVEHTSEEIATFPFYQTITGDSSDGLRGVFRVGAKGAEKALRGVEGDYNMWAVVLVQYAKKGQTIEEAIATMRCVRMDAWTPEGGYVAWHPPVKEL